MEPIDLFDERKDKLDDLQFIFRSFFGWREGLQSGSCFEQLGFPEIPVGSFRKPGRFYQFNRSPGLPGNVCDGFFQKNIKCFRFFNHGVMTRPMNRFNK
jgi:hypothetical protein